MFYHQRTRHLFTPVTWTCGIGLHKSHGQQCVGLGVLTNVTKSAVFPIRVHSVSYANSFLLTTPYGSHSVKIQCMWVKECFSSSVNFQKHGWGGVKQGPICSNSRKSLHLCIFPRKRFKSKLQSMKFATKCCFFLSSSFL